MSEIENHAAASEDGSLNISKLISSASHRISLERACRFIDRGIREMWPSEAGVLDDEDSYS
jgi:hypothetical protein